MLPQTACGVRCGDLELDLKKVKGIHAQRGSNSCPETCDCMVLIQAAFVILHGRGAMLTTHQGRCGKEAGWLLLHTSNSWPLILTRKSGRIRRSGPKGICAVMFKTNGGNASKEFRKIT